MRKISIQFILMIFLLVPSVFAVQEEIKLLQPTLDSGKLLMQALNDRKSERSFSKQEIPLQVLSNLLWAASGINRPDGRLTTPTTKNWQEIDIYAAMESGLYFYDKKNNVLSPVLQEDIRKYTGLQKFTQDAPVNLIYVADYAKMNGDKAGMDFYSAVDTGFISQNVYLFCASEGLCTVVLGWVDKIALEKKMGLNDNKKVLLTQPVGYRG
ncbi:nitroreductase family protein [bacterium]|nr:nitroreductase family protein [bacterium]